MLRAAPWASSLHGAQGTPTRRLRVRKASWITPGIHAPGLAPQNIIWSPSECPCQSEGRLYSFGTARRVPAQACPSQAFA